MRSKGQSQRINVVPVLGRDHHYIAVVATLGKVISKVQPFELVLVSRKSLRQDI
jgi:hypothetical protein